MSYTKKELIEMAFEEIGLANYNFDLQPEQFQSGLKRLDLMMATWNNRGIRIGYPLSSSPSTSNLNDDTQVRDTALEAIYSNLALKIAPSFGKTVSMDLKINARSTYLNLLRDTSEINERQLTKLPRGAGNKAWRYNKYNTFINPTGGEIDVGQDSQLDLT